MAFTTSSVLTAAGSGALTLLTLAGINTAIEKTGIEPHSLAYNGAGAITQSRTVHADTAYSAVFSAQIHTTTNPTRPICKGGGGWSYRPGTVTVDIPLDEWVGEAGCLEKLPTATWLIACAEWSAGEDVAALCSERFKL